MKIAFISDIHANFKALFTLDDVLNDVDRILFLGDAVGYYCQVNEVIEYLRNLNAICIQGNHDSFLLRGYPTDIHPSVRFGIEFAKKVIHTDHLQWLASLPLVWGGYFDDHSFLLVHGSPWHPLDDYMYSDSKLLKELETFDYDVLAFGQTHRVFFDHQNKPCLLNPGSVGQSRDVLGHACAITLDTESMKIEIIERPYEVDVVIDLARNNGASEWIIKHLM